MSRHNYFSENRSRCVARTSILSFKKKFPLSIVRVFRGLSARLHGITQLFTIIQYHARRGVAIAPRRLSRLAELIPPPLTLTRSASSVQRTDNLLPVNISAGRDMHPGMVLQLSVLVRRPGTHTRLEIREQAPVKP